MRYYELNESKTALASPRQFGQIIQGPPLYLHFTHTPGQVQSILQNGFDLGKFGFTAKKFRQQDMMRADPRGVFAMDAQGVVPQSRPYVIFKIEPSPNVLSQPDPQNPGYSEDLKKQLFGYYSVSGQKLSKILLGADIQVVHSTSEFIILDPSRIVVVKSSLDDGGNHGARF